MTAKFYAGRELDPQCTATKGRTGRLSVLSRSELRAELEEPGLIDFSTGIDGAGNGPASQSSPYSARSGLQSVIGDERASEMGE